MEEPKENWKMTTLIIGAVVGLISGLIAAYILVQRAEEEDPVRVFQPVKG